MATTLALHDRLARQTHRTSMNLAALHMPRNRGSAARLIQQPRRTLWTRHHRRDRDRHQPHPQSDQPTGRKPPPHRHHRTGASLNRRSADPPQQRPRQLNTPDLLQHKLSLGGRASRADAPQRRQERASGLLDPRRRKAKAQRRKRQLVAAAARSFDPDSAGARHLARTWFPRLELWRVRMPRRPIIEADGRVVHVHEGDEIEVPSDHGRQLLEDGSAALVSRRFSSARE